MTVVRRFRRELEVGGQRGTKSGETSQERSHIYEWSLEVIGLPTGTRTVVVDANVCPSLSCYVLEQHPL